MDSCSVTVLITVLASLLLFSEPLSLEPSALSQVIHLEAGSDLLAFNMYRTTLAYISCKNPDEFTTSCDLTVDTMGDGYIPKTCSNFLKEEQDDNSGMKSRVFLFDDDKVVIVWASHQKCNRFMALKVFFIPQFSCEVETSIIHLENRQSNVSQVLEHLLMLRTKNGFEMLYKDTCEEVCSVIFDSKGLKLRGRTNMNPTGRAVGYFVHPVEADSNLLSNGYCFLTKSEERLDASLLFTENMRQILDSAMSHGFEASSIKASTVSEVLSMCKQNSNDHTILNCSRGNSSTWLDLEFREEFQDPVVYNLPAGKFLTVTSRKRESNLDTEEDYFEFLLTAFDARGNQKLSVLIEKVYYRNKVDNVYVHIFENEAGYYCVSFFRQDENFRIVVKCFPKTFLFG